MHELTRDVVEYLPTAHCMHVVAPGLLPVFVLEPAAQSMQLPGAEEPAVATYLPAVQSEHEVTLDFVEYLPGAHCVQVVAPVSMPALVIEPASQSLHSLTFDVAEYLPAAHAKHPFAPAAEPVSVIDPAAHSGQYELALHD